jgi:predicted transcriptional regulator
MTSTPPAPPTQDASRTQMLALATRIVSAHLAHNPVQCTELPHLIQEVCQALVRLGVSSAVPARRTPTVPVRRSVFPDYIVCLEDGLRFKTLRRHLMAAFGLTPEQYRRRWGLPPDYPMIAPGYAADRSSLAKATGFGHTPAKAQRKAGTSK